MPEIPHHRPPFPSQNKGQAAWFVQGTKAPETRARRGFGEMALLKPHLPKIT
jgi:hypothetical protein